MNPMPQACCLYHYNGTNTRQDFIEYSFVKILQVAAGLVKSANAFNEASGNLLVISR